MGQESNWFWSLESTVVKCVASLKGRCLKYIFWRCNNILTVAVWRALVQQTKWKWLHSASETTVTWKHYITVTYRPFDLGTRQLNSSAVVLFNTFIINTSKVVLTKFKGWFSHKQKGARTFYKNKIPGFDVLISSVEITVWTLLKKQTVDCCIQKWPTDESEKLLRLQGSRKLCCSLSSQILVAAFSKQMKRSTIQLFIRANLKVFSRFLRASFFLFHS